MSDELSDAQRRAVAAVMLNPSVEDALRSGLRTTVSRFVAFVAPTTPDAGLVELREEIARIVDPEAWKPWADDIADVDYTEMVRRRTGSFAKADAILTGPLAAYIARVERELAAYRELRRGELWPEPLITAISALEEQYDVEMVSIEHHAKWVREHIAAEARTTHLADVNAKLVEALNTVANWADEMDAAAAAKGVRAYKAERAAPRDISAIARAALTLAEGATP